MKIKVDGIKKLFDTIKDAVEYLIDKIEDIEGVYNVSCFSSKEKVITIEFTLTVLHTWTYCDEDFDYEEIK